jgi:hypothetical protein
MAGAPNRRSCTQRRAIRSAVLSIAEGETHMIHRILPPRVTRKRRSLQRLLVTAISVLVVSASAVVATSAPAQAESPPIATKFELRSAYNGKCLEILGLNNSNGAGVGVWDCWGGANQLWYWDSGLQAIRSYMNHKCLEILSFNNSNGAQVGTWDCWGGANQRWSYPGIDGYTVISSYFNGKFLDLLYHDWRNGAWAGMWDPTWQSNQYWQVMTYNW